MPRPVHFEILCDDTERATKFYKGVFGWEFTKWDGSMPYTLVKTGEQGTPGIDGGLMDKGDFTQSTINTIDVPNCDEYVAKVTKHGGEVVMPKMAVQGVGWMAYLKDTEGNVFGIMQMDEQAK